MSIKVALCYDRVNKWGGAERVLLALHQIFPEAPLYTSVCDLEKAPWAKVFPKIITSFLQNVPFAKNHHEYFGWLMPLAFESFNFSDYDLVISVTSEAAKGIITLPKTRHVCYLLTPTRYLWSGFRDYFKNPIIRWISKPIVSWLRSWDKVAAQRPDRVVAISTEVAKRTKKYYLRYAKVIFPPLLLAHKPFGRNFQKKKYFLVVSRLVAYKKIDLVIKAFNFLKLPLVVIGTGKESSKLKRKARKNISFKGYVSEDKLVSYYTEAKALIMAQEEDFGLVALEALSLGVPVISYNKGGIIDIIRNKDNGILFNRQTVKSLVEALSRFDKWQVNKEQLVTSVRKFSKSGFCRTFVRACFSRRWGNQALA